MKERSGAFYSVFGSVPDIRLQYNVRLVLLVLFIIGGIGIVVKQAFRVKGM